MRDGLEFMFKFFNLSVWISKKRETWNWRNVWSGTNIGLLNKIDYINTIIIIIKNLIRIRKCWINYIRFFDADGFPVWNVIIGHYLFDHLLFQASMANTIGRWVLTMTINAFRRSWFTKLTWLQRTLPRQNFCV